MLNAHFLLGKPENAEALADYAARSDAPTPLRALAVQMLGDWPKPPRRDYITGLTQSLPPRPAEDAIEALTAVMDKLFAGPDAVRKEATSPRPRSSASRKSGPFLIELVGDAKAPANTRVDALKALAALNDPKLLDAAEAAVASDDPQAPHGRPRAC